MRACELYEGGWQSTATQSTKITPSTVKAVLEHVKQFTNDFNKYLKTQGVNPVKMGHPTGSSAYYKVDTEDKVYGDIDLQMIAPAQEGTTTSQLANMYNKHMDEFVATTKPAYIHYEGKSLAGHPIFKLNKDVFVQVDMLWASEPEADWARYRSTPERGIKGLVYGSIYSSLGNTLEMSIQSSGAQMKIKGGEPVNFARSRKVDSVDTLSLDQENFGIDILRELFDRVYPNTAAGAMQIAKELKQNPGIDKKNLKMSRLISVVRGLGRSFELNDMFGKYNLKDINTYDEYIERFMADMTAKTEAAKTAKKFDKAQTPEAKEKVKQIRKQIDDAMSKVNELVYA